MCDFVEKWSLKEDFNRDDLTDAQKAELQIELDRAVGKRKPIIRECLKGYKVRRDKELVGSSSGSSDNDEEDAQQRYFNRQWRQPKTDDHRSSEAIAAAATSYSALHAYLYKKVKVNLATRCTPFGFLLDSQYALGTKDLHGPDQMLYELLCSFAEFRVIVLPVLTAYNGWLQYEYGDYYDGSNDKHNHKETASVFPLTDAHVRGVLDNEIPNLASACGFTQAEADQMKDVRIVALDLRNGYEWYRSLEGSEYTGNESNSEVENSIWLHRALIVVRRSDATSSSSASTAQE